MPKLESVKIAPWSDTKMITIDSKIILPDSEGDYKIGHLGFILEQGHEMGNAAFWWQCVDFSNDFEDRQVCKSAEFGTLKEAADDLKVFIDRFVAGLGGEE